MKKRTLIIVIGFIALILLLGNFIVRALLDGGDPFYSNQKKGKIAQKAIEQKNSLLCNKLPEHVFMAPDPRDECYRAVAEALEDISICDEGFKDPRGFLRDHCYISIAGKTGDASICVKIKDPAEVDYCYLKITKVTHNKDYCNMIQQANPKTRCLGPD
mgnify:CR=1 FL=1